MLPYNKAAKILKQYRDWRNSKGKAKIPENVDEAIEVAIDVLTQASHREYHTDADRKIELIKSIIL